MVLNDAFMKSWQPAINNLYKQYGAPYGNGAPPPDGALADAKAAYQQRKSNYNSYMNQLEHPKLGYQDAVNYLNSNPDIKNKIKSQGAYAVAEGIRNDPTQQEAIKKQGYNVTDYINALYNAASDGKFASERAYNQYTKGIKTATKNASNPIQYTQADQNAITSAVNGKKTNAVMASATPNLKPQQHEGLFGRIGNELGVLKNDAGSVLNALFHPTSAKVNNQALQSIKKRGDVASPEVTRQANRMVDSASFGLYGNLDNKAHGGQKQSYESMDGRTGTGKTIDTISSLVGGLATGNTLLDALKLGRAGEMTAQGLKNLGVGEKAANIGGIATRGALAGGSYGLLQQAIDSGFNPNSETNGQRLGNIGLNTLLGAGAEVGLSGLGKYLEPLFKKVSSGQKLTPEETQQVQRILALPEPQKALPEPLYGNTKLPANNSQLQSVEKALQELHNTYQSKLVDHVNTGVENARQDFVNKGLDQYHQKAAELEAHQALASDYKAIKSAFPKGIQIPEANKNDFQLPPAFKAKKGSATDIYQAAEQTGFKSPDELVNYLHQIDQSHKLVNKTAKRDSLGFSTPEQAQKALEDHFNTNTGQKVLENLKNGFHQTPDAQAIQMSIDHLNQAKANMGEQPGGIMRNDKPLSYVGRNTAPLATKVQKVDPRLTEVAGLQANEMPKEAPPLANEPKAINIDQAPHPVKLTQSELAREANKEQFAANDANPHEPNIDNHITSKSDIPKPKVDHGEKFISDAIDNIHKLNGFDNATVDASGKELKASDSAYKQGLNSRSADVTTEQIVKHEMVTPKGKVVVDKNGKAVGSLKDIIGKMKPKEFKAFNKYLVLKHAITRMERGEKVYPDSAKMGPKKADAMVSKMEEQLPHFKELSNQVYKWNRALLKNWLVDGGIISKEDFKKFVQANPHYVPMHRVFDPLEAHMGKNAKRGFANQTNPVKEAIGSQRQIIDPIESMIEHANQYVKTVRRNEVGQAVVKAISNNPEALKGWAEIVPTDKGSHAFGDALASKSGDLKTEDDIQNFLENFNSAFDKKSDLTKGNIVRVLVNGKPVHLKVNDPAFLDALTNIGPAELPKWIKTIGAVTRSFKVLTTGTNPIFMARNMTRDIPMAYANSTTLSKGLKGQAQFAKDLLSAYWDVARNKQSLQDFKNMGGGHASSVASDTNQLAKTKQDLLPMKSISDLKEQGKNFATARFTLDALKRAHEKVIGGLEKVSNTVETAPRLAEYKRTVKQGGGTYDSKVQGIYNANDVTVNFNRFGTQAKQLDQLVPYLNASIQGIDKFVRAAKDNPAQFASRLGVGVGLPTALIYLANANDPNYQQLPKYLKDQYFMVPRGDGTFIKIAKPREIGAVTDGIERTLDALKGDPHAFQDYGKTLLSNFLPPVQTIDAPLQQVNANKSFTGAPIVSKSLQTMDPVHQYDSKDTGFAKGLAHVTNLIPFLPDQYKSPKNLDYLLKSYGGGLAQMLTSPKQALSSSFTADPVYSNDISTNFYNEQAKLDQARQVLKKKGIQDSALNEPLRQQFDAQARKISKVRKAMNTINDPKQKRLYQQMINQMEAQMNALVK